MYVTYILYDDQNGTFLPRQVTKCIAKFVVVQSNVPQIGTFLVFKSVNGVKAKKNQQHLYEISHITLKHRGVSDGGKYIDTPTLIETATVYARKKDSTRACA